ncbi:MAG: endolytic transglycosylase MltG [Bacteroidota bacterium]
MLKKLFYLFLLALVLGGFGVYWAYGIIFSPNTAFNEDIVTIQIPKNSSFDDVVQILKEANVLTDETSFRRVSEWMNYQREEVPSGNFELKKGWNNKELISKLRSGVQKPVKITFNNVRTVEELMGPLSATISLDSSELAGYFLDPVVQDDLGFSKETMLTMFIPNTYEMYWDMNAENLANRLLKEHDAFWNKNDRRSKAEQLNMSPAEVYTLASIVEKESQYGPERPIIAGLYLNRIERGIPLQADPTVVFANGDFGIRRVLNKHLKYDSPYNTYLYNGLPPGPIYMPSIESIDAVLNPEEHDYIFMCAKPGYGTQHAFAKTNRGHAQNARKYHEWLSQQGIR